MGATLSSKVKCCCDKEVNVINITDVYVHTQKSLHEENKEVIKERRRAKSPNPFDIQRTVTGAFNKLEMNNNLKLSESNLKNRDCLVKDGCSNNQEQPVTIKPEISYAGPEIVKESQKSIVRNSGEYTYPFLNNYTFSKDSNGLVKENSHSKSLLRCQDIIKNIKMSYIPKQISMSNEIIMQTEFILNSNTNTLNNKIVKSKTKNHSNVKRYVLLTRASIKICKSRDYYISYGTCLIEVLISHITGLEYTKNPFSKSTLHTIYIIHGKEGIDLSISSEDGNDVYIWYKILQFLMS